MSDKPFPNMSYGGGSSDFHSQGSRYDPSTSQTQSVYQRGAHQQHQSQYPSSSSSSLQTPVNVHGHSSEAMSSMRVNSTNVYPESSQRTFLGETMRDNMGYNSILNSFDAPHVAGSSTNPYSFGSLDISAPSVDDHTPSLAHLRFPPTRPSSQQDNLPLRKMTDSSFSTLQLHPPSDYHPSTFSQSMTYSSLHGQSANAESPTPPFGGHSLGSFSHDHHSAENSPPGSASSYQAGAMGNDRLSNPRYATSSHLNPPPPSGPPISQSTSSSIPMRKASSEWMMQSGFLPVPKHGIGISHKRYTSPAVAPGALLPDAFLGAEARASDLPPLQDAKTYLDQPFKRMSSPSVPSNHNQQAASSKSTSPAPPESQPGDGPPAKKKKKSKMHACEICNKKFPRPSGLKTHMNTHNNARPYPCGFPGCNRTFGVRSNAKRHLRTHGVVPPPPGEGSSDAYVVGFSPPVVAPAIKNEQQPSLDDLGDEHRYTGKAPFFKLRWMPPSLNSRTNADSLQSVSESGEFSDEDGEEDEELDHSLLTRGRKASGSLSDLSVPRLSPSRSSSATGSPDCACNAPCGANPCLTLIASNMALSSRHPSASHSLESFADAVPRIAKDTSMSDESSSQVDTLPSL